MNNITFFFLRFVKVLHFDGFTSYAVWQSTAKEQIPQEPTWNLVMP